MKKYKPIVRYSLLFLCFAVVFLTGRCTKQENVNTGDLRHFIIDSIQTVHYIKEKAKIDSILIVERKKYESIKPTKITYTKIVTKYKTDTIIQTPICDSIIVECDNIIDTLETKNEQCQQVLFVTENKLELIENELTNKINNLQSANESIARLQKANKRTWWERNQKWLYLGSGIVGTALIMK